MKARTTLSYLALLLFSAAILSGCVGAEDEVDPAPEAVAEEPDDVEVTATTGSVQGKVASDLFEPLVGATVTVVENGVETRVARNGAFVLNGLDPGRYTLHIVAVGYESVQRPVEVVAGEVTEVNIVMRPLASDEPFVDELEHKGKVTLAIAWQIEAPTQGCIVVVSPVPGVVPDGKTCGGIRLGVQTEKALNITQDVKTVMAEMVWQPAGPLGEYLSLDLLCPEVPRGFGGAVQDPEHPCFFGTPSRSSPVIHRIDEAHWMEHGYNPVGDWAARIFGTYGTAGTYDALKVDAGAAYEQQFTVYFSVFHKEGAPEGYTGIPDA